MYFVHIPRNMYVLLYYRTFLARVTITTTGYVEVAGIM